VPALLDDAMGAVLDDAVARAAAAGGEGFADDVPWVPAAYDACLAAARERTGEDLLRVVRQAASVLDLATEVRTRLPGIASPRLAGMKVDVAQQLDELLPHGFITAAGVDRLPDLVRYLRAVLRRLDTAPEDTGRDQARQAQVEAVLADYEDALAALHPSERQSAAAREVRWMIEELRVNLFAQNLGTRHPVSDKRIHKALDALLGMG
jgi:ATP-dependent helicase HrpA